jgi:hypothetical protein
MFRRNILSLFSGVRQERNSKQGAATLGSEASVNLARLHGVTFQKIGLFRPIIVMHENAWTVTVTFSGLNVSKSNIAHYEKVWGSRHIDPHFLDFGTSWRWLVSFKPLLLYLRRKSPRYPFDRRLGGHQSRSGQFGERKILDPTGTLNSEPSV